MATSLYLYFKFSGEKPQSFRIDVTANDGATSNCVNEPSPKYATRNIVRLDCVQPVLGDEVTVTIEEDDTYLNMYEVVVYGRAPGNKPHKSFGASVMQLIKCTSFFKTYCFPA